MGYHPETLAFSFPPCPSGGVPFTRKDGTRDKGRWTVARALYALRPWIGFDVWHIDPERRSEDQRTDDSCGWFDRRPREYAEAVEYLLKDTSTVHEIELIMERGVWTRCAYQAKPGDDDYNGKLSGYPRLSSADALALCMLVARELETRRWWNTGKRPAHSNWWRRTFARKRDVLPVAMDLALNPIDNLVGIDDPARAIRLIAGALARRFKPWWRHPRWHVHHWRVNFDLPRNLRRMFQRCDGCGDRLGFGHCPVVSGSNTYHSSGCAYSPVACAASPSPIGDAS